MRGIVFFGSVLEEGDFAFVEFVADADDVFVGVFSDRLVFRKDFPEGGFVGAREEVILKQPLVVFVGRVILFRFELLSQDSVSGRLFLGDGDQFQGLAILFENERVL